MKKNLIIALIATVVLTVASYLISPIAQEIATGIGTVMLILDLFDAVWERMDK